MIPTVDRELKFLTEGVFLIYQTAEKRVVILRLDSHEEITLKVELFPLD